MKVWKAGEREKERCWDEKQVKWRVSDCEGFLRLLGGEQRIAKIYEKSAISSVCITGRPAEKPCNEAEVIKICPAGSEFPRRLAWAHFGGEGGGIFDSEPRRGLEAQNTSANAC
jgi:hypothetical protein